MNALPDDCLRAIFDLLQPAWTAELLSASHVCRRWRAVIRDWGQCWASIRIPDPENRFSTPKRRLALLETASARARALNCAVRLTVVGVTDPKSGAIHNPFDEEHGEAARAIVRHLKPFFVSLSLLSPGFEGVLDGTEEMPLLKTLFTDPPAPFDVSRAPQLREFRGVFAPALDPAAAWHPNLTSIDVSLRSADAANFFVWFPQLERLVLRDIVSDDTDSRIPFHRARTPLRHIGWHGERGAAEGSLPAIPRAWICGQAVSVAVLAYTSSDTATVGCSVLQAVLEESVTMQWELMDVSASPVAGATIRLTTAGGACSLTAEIRAMNIGYSWRMLALLHDAARPDTTRIPLPIMFNMAKDGARPGSKISLRTRYLTIVYSSDYTAVNKNVVLEHRINDFWLQLEGVARVTLVAEESDLRSNMKLWVRANLRRFLTRSVSPRDEAKEVPEVHLEGIERLDDSGIKSWRKALKAADASWTTGALCSPGTVVLTGIQCASM